MPPSLPVKVNDADVLAVGLVGLDVIVVSGAVMSMSQVYDAGVGSTLPALSMARTSKVCEPSASPA